MDREPDGKEEMSPPLKRQRLDPDEVARRIEDLEEDDEELLLNAQIYDGVEDLDGDSEERMEWRKEGLLPPMEHEIEFLLKDPKSYKQGQSVHSFSKTLHGCFSFRLLVFPMGTEITSPQGQLAAFVEALAPPGCEEIRWGFEGVKYQITAVNWKDYRKSTTQVDNFTFTKDHSDRGWHKGFVKASQMTVESGWLNSDGELCLRASCSSRRAMIQASARRAPGHVGLKNHGATCYMNCLLQTLFCLGHFRHIAYSIEVPESDVVSSDDLSELGDDDRPALPLLVSLQNLFYRLQTSEVPVSCRELMRSFGWDTADAFMQHDAQELNRLLCDRLEEQMKGTATDGEIKRLFEGEFENYIECIDVDYRSQRNETFYDLQLNVKDESGAVITSLEDSLRDFVREEILEGDNAYDAESHGKQRARKGIRFKRFPPVLYIQLKRFMFDIEKMDMNKLNSTMEFPQILDLEAFAKGSGQYMLHTIIVHSGGVSSGHYYTFVRSQSEGKSQWIKFDDETVSYCCEQAAVEDNYGGEDLNVVNYFTYHPQEIRDREWPTGQRIHNAYMLSYVRIDQKELLTPPLLSLEDAKYRTLIERCTREAKLCEERRRDRVQRMNRVEVKILFEGDLMKMKGFWPSQDDFPTDLPTMNLSREDTTEVLVREALELPIFGEQRVSEDHVALFALTTRKTRQMRFKHLPLEDQLKNHMQAMQSVGPPQMIVLVMVSQGYDPLTLQKSCSPDSAEEEEAFHDLAEWTEEMVLLIVKYYCPVKQVIVTLGCYYQRLAEPLKAMLHDDSPWLTNRLQLFVQSGEVAAPPQKTQWHCWEEFGRTPKDIRPRDIQKTMKDEGLYCGDVVIWQPSPSAMPRRPGPEAAEENLCANVRDFSEQCMNHISVVVRQMTPEAPAAPEGLYSGLDMGQTPHRVLLQRISDEDEVELSMEVPGQVKAVEMTVDVRWRTDHFASKVLKALDLEEESEKQRFWLFDGGAPTAHRGGTLFHSKDNPPLATLLQTGWTRNINKRSVYAVLLPEPPENHHSVAVHFFDPLVREVGACILSVSEEECEQNGGKHHGCFYVDPKKLLALARQYLEKEGAEIRQRMCPEQQEHLRILEVAGGQIHRVYRERSSGKSSLWQARLDDPTSSPNFLYSSFRVEPDDLEAQEQLVEVFNMDPNEVIYCFGHPFLLSLREGQLGKEILAATQEKLRCSSKDFRQCRVVVGKSETGELNDGTKRGHVRQWKEVTEDFVWSTEQPDERPKLPGDFHVENMALCIERMHPLYAGRQGLRHGNKPLTIKAG